MRVQIRGPGAPRHEIWLTALIALLALPTHLIGLTVAGVYRDPAVLIPQNYATDLVTLAIGIPLLVWSAFAMRQGSLAARIVWLGTLGFLVYDYGMYVMAVRWNRLFLLYLALFGVSLFALVEGLGTFDVRRLGDAMAGPVPRRGVATYLIAVAVAVGAMWLSEEVRATLSGVVPATVDQFETPTNIVHVFDLGIVLPAMVVAGLKLLKGHPWGYLLAGVLLVKASTIGLWVVAMMWFSARSGYPSPAPYAALFLGLTAAGALLSWRFLRSIEPRGRAGALAPA